MFRTLNELRPGESATVRGLLPDDGRDIVSRLMDLGLTQGARVRCLFAAPGGRSARLSHPRGGDRPCEARTRNWCASLRAGGERMNAPAREARPLPVVVLAGNPNVGTKHAF